MTTPTQSGVAVGHGLLTVVFQGLTENEYFALLHEHTKLVRFERCDGLAERDAARAEVEKLRGVS